MGTLGINSKGPLDSRLRRNSDEEEEDEEVADSDHTRAVGIRREGRRLQATKFPTTRAPSLSPVTQPPTQLPSLSPLTPSPTVTLTQVPSNEPSTSPPTMEPTLSPTMSIPSTAPTISAPSTAPTDSAPSTSPQTSTPSSAPTRYLVPRPVIMGYSGPSLYVTNVTTNSSVYEFYNAQSKLNSFVNFTADVFPGELPEGLESAQQFAVANITNEDAFLYSTIVTQGAIPVASDNVLPLGLEIDVNTGDLIGSAQTLSDLTVYPITCISYPSAVPQPGSFEATVMRNGSEARLFVKAWGRSGYVDAITGEMIGFWDQANVTGNTYPVSFTVQPYFCPLFWLGINTIGGESYSTGIISAAFHTVRNSGGVSYAVYPDNPAFGGYEVYLFLGAIPFWALTIACIILYPSYIFFQFCCRGTKCESCMRKCCCGRFRTDEEQALLDAEKTIMQNDHPGQKKKSLIRANSSRRLLTRSGSKKLRARKSRKKIEVENKDEEDDFFDEDPEEENDPSSEVVKKYQKAIDRILTSPHVSKRFCFLFVAVIAIPSLTALTIGHQMSFADSDAKFITANNALNTASNASTLALVTLNETIEHVSRSSGVFGSTYGNLSLALLLQERDRICRLISMSNPQNLRVERSVLSNLMISDEVQLIIELVTFIIQWFGPFLILVSLILASCTCRWGESVLFEPASVCLGLSLKGWLILCATLAWFCVMFFFWNTAVLADICYLPSIIHVPNVTSSAPPLLKQPVAYDPADNNYYFPYGYESNVLAKFYWQCRFDSPTRPSSLENITETSFEYYQYNPMSFYAIQANQFNAMALSLALTAGDNRTIAELVQVQRMLQDSLDFVQCDRLAQPILEGMELLCGTNITGFFLSFFFLCTIGVLYMIVIPCTSWIAPNLFRQWQANRMYERASKETERLIKIASKMSMAQGLKTGASKNPTRASGTASFGGSFQILRQLAGGATPVSTRKDSILPNDATPVSPANASINSFGSTTGHQMGQPQSSSADFSTVTAPAMDVNASGFSENVSRKSSIMLDDLAIA